MKQEIRRGVVVIVTLCLVVWAGQLTAQDKTWEDLDKKAKQAKIDETAKESLDERGAEESGRAGDRDAFTGKVFPNHRSVLANLSTNW